MTIRPASAMSSDVDPLALDPADRQVEEDVDDPVEPEPLERLGERRADALQHLHFGEQRIENVGAHGYLRIS